MSINICNTSTGIIEGFEQPSARSAPLPQHAFYFRYTNQRGYIMRRITLKNTNRPIMATLPDLSAKAEPFSFSEFSDYLASKGMDRNVACYISDGLGLTKKEQLRFVTEHVIQDIQEECFDHLKVSDENLDLLRKICQEYKEEKNGAK